MAGGRAFCIIPPMSPHDLVRMCNDAMRGGVDFPTLWHTVIRPHPAVIGVPVQRLDGDRTYLEVPLLRGEWLVVDTQVRAVSLR
jgi:hypothetical protein